MKIFRFPKTEKKKFPVQTASPKPGHMYSFNLSPCYFLLYDDGSLESLI